MNIYDGEVPREDEVFTTLHKTDAIEIVRIISGEVATPKEFIDTKDEWVVLLKGKAKLQMDERIYELEAGDTLFIPANTSHFLLSVTPGSLWLAVHYDPKRCG
ncbi:cupin domain-containing protein [Nitratiruptor tergarcus]|uniref:Cupin 2 domain-containing protein n=1 Tax=Nitratiruptor tergarcus DSM 16512 TaxID=1069081 RepID=A0A1W1WQY2_9BACT|nr:cupin domain-containing protein [Nitratiruptor tergarcus]SMC08430.1 cupin 2 domain-containing protein [Nitratiruptor tergarcus DSM 16512]